mmetsp:Transcript_33949/g.86795  ORF Transcript_33949/g.86795 Transcript_33949/m.86795 type:complete len:331 (+) Transcript_33949:2704-3696(+)
MGARHAGAGEAYRGHRLHILGRLQHRRHLRQQHARVAHAHQVAAVLKLQPYHPHCTVAAAEQPRRALQHLLQRAPDAHDGARQDGDLRFAAPRLADGAPGSAVPAVHAVEQRAVVQRRPALLHIVRLRARAVLLVELVHRHVEVAHAGVGAHNGEHARLPRALQREDDVVDAIHLAAHLVEARLVIRLRALPAQLQLRVRVGDPTVQREVVLNGLQAGVWIRPEGARAVPGVTAARQVAEALRVAPLLDGGSRLGRQRGGQVAVQQVLPIHAHAQQAVEEAPHVTQLAVAHAGAADFGLRRRVRARRGALDAYAHHLRGLAELAVQALHR